MKVRVVYDNGQAVSEFEYFSKYNRTNAKGIRTEIKEKMSEKYGQRGWNYSIKNVYRV